MAMTNDERMTRRGTINHEGEEISVIFLRCGDCGEEYPIGGDSRMSSPEGPEHHDPDCPMRKAMIRMGRWEAPDG